MTHILAIDQGTTSTRAIIFGGAFDSGDAVRAVAQEEFPQHYPASGWVEHDPADIWATVVRTARAALAKAGLEAADIAAIGITNQRETTLLWDRATGAPLHNAIVWQDRRTAEICAALRDGGHEPLFTERTGLLLDPYFSGTKLKWLLDTLPGARARAERGELAFGTVDSFLIWKLTGGRVHATDATNAARTLLYDIGAGSWDAELCRLLDIPVALLPDVRDCAADFGVVDHEILGGPVPIRGVAGDQQAALIGQACFLPGMLKSTYGTGCFALLNTGGERVTSRHRLLTTIAYQLDGHPTYALEGSIFVAGAVVQWLRDRLGLVDSAAATQVLAGAADPGQNLVLVPAFTGLGAPYWRPECRGAVFGLTRNSGAEELARAALESVGYQTRDLLEAMRVDWGASGTEVLRVDGGMAANDWAMQFLADILGTAIDRPISTETTARGAAYLAALGAGIAPAPMELHRRWNAGRRFEPVMSAAERQSRYGRWQRAVAACLAI